MSWHNIAYFATNAAAATNADTAFVSDLGVVPTFNGHALLPDNFMLTAAQAMGASLLRARLDSGQLRVLGQPYLHPVIAAAVPGSNPNTVWYFRAPFQLPQREEIAAQLTNNAGAPENETVGIWLHKSFDSWGPQNIWIVRATSTTATVANKWTNIGQPTMETALPVGTYTLLWWDAQSTNGQFLRWVFPPTSRLRPGMGMLTSIQNRQNNEVYQGVLGAAGQFVNDVLPFMEVLANAADASFELRLAIQRSSSMIGAPPAMGLPGLV